MSKLTVCYLYEFKDGMIAWSDHITTYTDFNEFMSGSWKPHHEPFGDRILAWAMGTGFEDLKKDVHILLPMTEKREKALKFFDYIAK